MALKYIKFLNKNFFHVKELVKFTKNKVNEFEIKEDYYEPIRKHFHENAPKINIINKWKSTLKMVKFDPDRLNLQPRALTNFIWKHKEIISKEESLWYEKIELEVQFIHFVLMDKKNAHFQKLKMHNKNILRDKFLHDIYKEYAGRYKKEFLNDEVFIINFILNNRKIES